MHANMYHETMNSALDILSTQDTHAFTRDVGYRMRYTRAMLSSRLRQYRPLFTAPRYPLLETDHPPSSRGGTIASSYHFAVTSTLGADLGYT